MIRIKKDPSTYSTPLSDYYLHIEDDWELWEQFIDHSSGLWIVKICRKKPTKNGQILSCEYKVEPSQLKILDSKEWQSYFSYEKIETYSSDNTYRQIQQRVYNSERDSDEYHEFLYEVETGKLLVGPSISSAFKEKKHVDLIEQQQLNEEKDKVNAQIEKEKLTIEEAFTNEIKSLKNSDLIGSFSLANASYTLYYKMDSIYLEKHTKTHNNVTSESHSFSSFNNLNAYIFSLRPWESDFSLNTRGVSSNILTYSLLMELQVKKMKHDYTYEEYFYLYKFEDKLWMSHLKSSERKQACPICFQVVRFNPRYPKYICSECRSHKIFDEEGKLIDFYNINWAGGIVKVTFDDNGNEIQEDTSSTTFKCYVDGHACWAEEARFGGIVIQKI